MADLRARCPRIDEDFRSGTIHSWLNLHIPAPRSNSQEGRLADLLVGPRKDGTEDPSPDFRICVEHKSVVTAHRNARNRFGDLNEILEMVHRGQPHAVLVATILLGVKERVLNVPDRVEPINPSDFEGRIRPRLATGDQGLWTDFPYAISRNKAGDPAKTLRIFRELKTRPYSRTDIVGYDFVLVAPVAVDNVDPPTLARDNGLGIDIDADYARMIETICQAYSFRWPRP